MKKRSPVVVFLSIAILALPLLGYASADENASDRSSELSGVTPPRIVPNSFHSTATCSIGGFTFDGPDVLPVAPPEMPCPLIVTPEQTACNEVGGRTTLTANCVPICSRPIAPAGRVAGFDLVGYTQRTANTQPGLCPGYPSLELIGCYLSGGVNTRDAQCRDICSIPISFPGEVTGYSFTAFVSTLAPYPGQACPAVATPELVACDASGGIAKKTFECDVLCSTPIAPVCASLAK